MSDKRMIRRIVAWANIDASAWRKMARDAGYDIDHQRVSANTDEYRLSRDGEVRGIVARVNAEWYAFVWHPCSMHWRDHLRWRLRQLARRPAAAVAGKTDV